MALFSHHPLLVQNASIKSHTLILHQFDTPIENVAYGTGCFVRLGLYQLGRTVVAFAATYRAAQKTGLPIIFSLVSGRNPIWLITQKQVAPFLQSLPFGLGAWVEYTIRGWLWADQDKIIQKLGKSWAMVSPRGLDVSDLVFQRKMAFTSLHLSLLCLDVCDHQIDEHC